MVAVPNNKVIWPKKNALTAAATKMGPIRSTLFGHLTRKYTVLVTSTYFGTGKMKPYNDEVAALAGQCDFHWISRIWPSAGHWAYRRGLGKNVVLHLWKTPVSQTPGFFRYFSKVDDMVWCRGVSFWRWVIFSLEGLPRHAPWELSRVEGVRNTLRRPPGQKLPWTLRVF